MSPSQTDASLYRICVWSVNVSELVLKVQLREWTLSESLMMSGVVLSVRDVPLRLWSVLNTPLRKGSGLEITSVQHDSSASSQTYTRDLFHI